MDGNYKNNIGILTFQSTSNFGSFFQAIGLYYALVYLGRDCQIINYKCDGIEERERMLYPDSMSLKNLLRFFLYKKKFRRRYDCLEDCLKSYAECTKEYTKKDVNQLANTFDNIIVGSDLVWSFETTKKDLTYYLDFVEENTKMFSYASSIGKKITNDEKSAIKKYIVRFSKIGVREQDTADEISKILNRQDVISVCDPTMLVYDKWDDILSLDKENSQKFTCLKKYILLYFPDSDGKMRGDAKYLSKKLGLDIVCINSIKPDMCIMNISVDSPLIFLELIKNAALVLSGSYHGTLFSIYYKVPFFYYVRAHGGRMEFLSRKLDFTEREASKVRFTKEPLKMDFSHIIQRIDEYRNESYVYLSSIIEDMK